MGGTILFDYWDSVHSLRNNKKHSSLTLSGRPHRQERTEGNHKRKKPNRKTKKMTMKHYR
jgi:hypothetical protein